MGMTIDFSGKTVLVTGAGRGLGRDMALQFADCGADVYMGNRKEDQGLSVVREIEAMGRRAGFTKCDVSNEEDVAKLVSDAVDFGNGTLDVIVNAAGVMSVEDLMYTSDPEMERVLNINVVGPANVLKHGLKVMKAQHHGNIIIVSSIAGRDGGSMLQIYSASKAAATSLVQSGAKMGAPYGVRVNGILPGIIRTAMWDQILDGMARGWDPANTQEVTPEKRDELWEKSVASMIPVGHAQTGKDIAYATVFMASDYASEITGECLAIDGGTTSGR